MHLYCSRSTVGVRETQNVHKSGKNSVCPLVSRDPDTKNSSRNFGTKHEKMPLVVKSIKSWYDKFKAVCTIDKVLRTGRPLTLATVLVVLNL